MCRSIKVLRRPEEVATPAEVSAASLQFVRKVSGFRAPSKANQQAFDSAVQEIAEVTARLLSDLQQGRARTSPSQAETGTDAHVTA
jgi:hypothetical protein